jgi:hypothetical protein
MAMAEDGGSQPLVTATTSQTPRFDVPPRSNASKKKINSKEEETVTLLYILNRCVGFVYLMNNVDSM